jgi:hypothetical protein
MANTTPFAPPWDLATGKLPDVVNGYQWELYYITEDFSQNNDLATKNPDKAAPNLPAFAISIICLPCPTLLQQTHRSVRAGLIVM